MRTGKKPTGRPKGEFCSRGHLLAETRVRTALGHSFCGVCRKRRDKQADVRRYYKRYYGVTAEFIDGIFLGQGLACAICEKRPLDKKDKHVDHDHKTGAVRGILCQRCNMAIGLMADESSRLRKAADYLDRSVK